MRYLNSLDIMLSGTAFIRVCDCGVANAAAPSAIRPMAAAVKACRKELLNLMTASLGCRDKQVDYL
ncbi:hypothetical protein MBOU_03040 [Mycobacterium bourgelatii]|uniref:Uncharacterized protein n=1 Tax=Mycobacterium bourgelatii TaxID=1273442 RepID=A0A7I9YI93_MYCBU|nr:hypothetical protein MBOU_03040 [Mycobacterium bourgelatii]